MSKVLHLTVTKKWFDMIASGEKKEEYREIKPFYNSRLLEVIAPLSLPMFTIHYKELNDMFWYSHGFKGTRANGLNFLFESGCLRWKEYDFVVLRNGYGRNAPTIKVECNGFEIGPAKPEWSDNWKGEVFIIKLGNIVSPTNA